MEQLSYLDLAVVLQPFSKKSSFLLLYGTVQVIELSVNDAVKEVDVLNPFMDKLYTIYHASPKNARELKVCAQTLETQILKLGQILSKMGCFQLQLMWQNSEAMVLHFEEAKKDRTRDKKDCALYEGLLRKISSTEFILDLGLMCDSLQEL
ncbi:hypothetical protein PR048_015945 [Dryococelus australis]|uniref:Uncharacterized protein n=1 Tax=Dryococelus australis TaxID=614101 RepID=A0ABQ9HID8_9NEOP|nr:hypothetical protein PR048_015945 [Dryococelus australis]